MQDITDAIEEIETLNSEYKDTAEGISKEMIWAEICQAVRNLAANITDS